MASIYSQLLGKYNQSASGNNNLFTAGAGVTTIIRDIQMVNGDAGVAMKGYILINGVGYFYRSLAAGPDGISVECRMVLTPGDVVNFYTSAGYGACYVSGYVLVS